jgi:2-polyprenyl-3-methyl-5-hydroxy-6-metoxy-1,4-benzoquinol methylase
VSKLKAVKKVKKGNMVYNVLKRVLYPQHIYKVIKLQRNKNNTDRVFDDAQLKLYSTIIPGDFLHYGYFEDIHITPQDISLNAIYKAQLKYAEMLLDKITDKKSPVLDIGCGMGGLLKLMLDRGLSPVALSPDKTQIRYVQEKYPTIKALESMFEDMSPVENEYGTVITSESLQYLQLDKALPLLKKILKPGGKWIACDYFRVGTNAEKSGHYWEQFQKQVNKAGWKITFQQDITLNVLPTISYVYMWGNNIIKPVKDFAFEKLNKKQPGVNYIFQDLMKTISHKLDKSLDVVNPETFAANKQYVLMVLEQQD